MDPADSPLQRRISAAGNGCGDGQEVAVWFVENLDEPQLVGDPRKALFITAFNASLQWRNVHQALSTYEQKRLRQLAG